MRRFLRNSRIYFAGGSVFAVTTCGLLVGNQAQHTPSEAKTVDAAVAQSAPIRVDTIHPAQGGVIRTAVQPGSAHAFQHASLFAKVSGFLKTQEVDIGSRVKKGEILAEIDAPELHKEQERAQAELRQADAEIKQAEANVATSQAEHKAAQSFVSQCEANVKRAQSERAYREKQLQRVRELHERKSVEERLVDERFDQFQAAQAAELAAQSAVQTAQEQATAAAAKIRRAQADQLVAEAKRQVAAAELSRTQVMVSYTRIVSTYDGIVTARNFHPGDFIRAAERGEDQPLLCVNRIDLMRVVVQVPDRDVPHTQAGDKATVLFDALPGRKFAGEIARVSATENRESRTMRVEIDVPNPDEMIRDGMYGQVEIALEDSSAGVTIPSACLVGAVMNGQAKIFVVEAGTAKLRGVEAGKDTGAFVEVKTGLTTADEVVVAPPSALADGMLVNPVTVSPATKAVH